MSGTTSTYGLPYQTNGDPPNGPLLGQNLAEAVETQLARVDTDLTRADVVLGETYYGVSQTYTVRSNTTNVRADVDAAMTLTFTAPSTGRVWIELEGMAATTGVTAGTGVFGTYWCLRNTADGTLVANSSLPMLPTGVDTQANRLRYSTKVTGLTSGTTYTYAWQHFRGTGGTGTAWWYIGGGVTALMRARRAI